jgi:hypothetical protein
MEICKKEFKLDGNEYEIHIELENDDLAHGDFTAQAFLNGNVYSEKVRQNAMKALIDTMENNQKNPFYDIINMTECNIKQGFNLKDKTRRP